MRLHTPVAILLLVGVSCAGRLQGSPSPVRIGGSWESARSRVEAWTRGSPGRGFAIQDLDRAPRRLHPPLDSLFVAQSIRDRAGRPVERAERRDAGEIAREHYIFYLRGDLITGVEYRAVLANGLGGYRQVDHALGETPGVPPGNT